MQAGADVDAADNRKITPLMAAFRKVLLICDSFGTFDMLLTCFLNECIISAFHLAVFSLCCRVMLKWFGTL